MEGRGWMIGGKDYGSNSFFAVYRLPSTDRGVALVAALVVTLAVALFITGTLYVVTHSTIMSGTGMRYSTASEAADGSIEIMKSVIRLVAQGEPVTSLPINGSPPACLLEAVLFGENIPCTVRITLPGTGLLSSYEVSATVTRLYSSPLPGSRLEFPKSGFMPPSVAIYYRIDAIVTGAGGARAETSALYRYVS